MYKLRKVFSLFCFAAALLSFSIPAFADFRLYDSIEEFGEKRYVKPEVPGNIKAGPVRVHPSLHTNMAYDSNILREDEDARQDVVLNVRPGAILELPINKHQIAVGYEADFENFFKRRDHKQNDQNQDMFALLDLHFADWYFNVLEQLSETSSRSGTTFTERIPRIDQTVNPKIGYKWKRTTFETGFHHFSRNFRRQIDDPLDFRLREWNGVIYYDLFARLKALVDYQFAQIGYEDNPSRNGTFNQARIGLEGEVRPNLAVKVRTGFQSRNYGATAEHDFHNWVAAIEAKYAIRQNIRLLAEFRREPVEATFQDVNFYLRHYLRLGAEYDIRPRWTAFAGVRYYNDRYAERATLENMTGFRHDNHVGPDVGLRYLAREWLNFELGYQFLHRTSNFPGLDYNEHVVYLSSGLTY